MIHVAFKTIHVVNPKGGQEADILYRELIQSAIHSPLDGKSLGLDEIRKGVRILDALENGSENGADFEDADHAFLVQKVNALKFMWADPKFVQFADDIALAPKTKKKESGTEIAEQ